MGNLIAIEKLMCQANFKSAILRKRCLIFYVAVTYLKPCRVLTFTSPRKKRSWPYTNSISFLSE